MAPNARGQVVIFKAPNESDKEQKDPYHDLLSKNGFEVINIPVLDFEFVNIDNLFSKLSKPDDYSGIIFSSPRCVKGCKLAFDKDASLLAKWKLLRNYAVGEATARMAEEIGLEVLGRESGNANALADIITKCTFDKPFLYPIGSLTNNNFKLRLKENNVEVDDVVVYKTKQHPDLEVNIKRMVDVLVEPYFLYFSPSGVNFTLPILRSGGFDFGKVKFVAIGPTTEKCMVEEGIKVYCTVAKPNPESTLEALMT